MTFLRWITIGIVWLLCTQSLLGQNYRLTGSVRDTQNKALEGAEVFIESSGKGTHTDKKGNYKIENIPSGKVRIIAFYMGMTTALQEIYLQKDSELNFILTPLVSTLEEVAIVSENSPLIFGSSRLNSVEGTAIYESKKTEVIELQNVQANLATNNSREIFARVSGLNIWESDGAGLQLGIGGRGLSPNRTANFNTRQNGYDISADALGYPESYYTPPTEALERIEVIRGAASLQYGTQFGGMLNFVFKKPPKDKKIQLLSRQTHGSFGLYNSFNHLSGTLGKWDYSTFYQYKRGEGWRANSGFQSHTAHAALGYTPNQYLRVQGEYTYMKYVAQQAGGLTDVQFAQNPQQSIRARNWFQVHWNLASVTADVKLSDRSRINHRSFFLYAGRDALGYLGPINRTDPMDERNFLSDTYKNYGNETRFMHRYTFRKQPAVFVVGMRYYQGNTLKNQGLGSAGSDADFTFLNPEELENSSYTFPSHNIAGFAEHIFHFGKKFSVTPGMRWEYIRTSAQGYYWERYYDFAGNILFEEKKLDALVRPRSLLLAGIGASYKFGEDLEVYTNVSQNYRAINFTDLRVVNPNFKVDPNIQDERGYNADLGFRGRPKPWLNMDISLYLLQYSNRIGLLMQVDSVLFNTYRLRTNIADSRSVGIESMIEIDLLQALVQRLEAGHLTIFGNIGLTHARYLKSGYAGVSGKNVELVPPMTLKTGISYKRGGFSASYQYARTATHYTDATNAVLTATAVDGLIPAYGVMDVSLGFQKGIFSVYGGVNNVANHMYFTRRASGYPGPGIIPSDGRSVYIGLQVKW